MNTQKKFQNELTHARSDIFNADGDYGTSESGIEL